jgi:hypothetical protein
MQRNSQRAPHVVLDFRSIPLDDAELEAAIDGADAVVLPYKTIMNSGSALLALSRNRPVLAPNVGSLPEVRECVGADWLYLYDGDFREEVLRDFERWLRKTDRSVAPLGPYEFSRIGRDLRGFIDAMSM